MEHRGFLANPEAHRPLACGDLFARIGGAASVKALVDGLSDRIEHDATLRPLFDRDLTGERAGIEVLIDRVARRCGQLRRQRESAAQAPPRSVADHMWARREMVRAFRRRARSVAEFDMRRSVAKLGLGAIPQAHCGFARSAAFAQRFRQTIYHSRSVLPPGSFA